MSTPFLSELKIVSFNYPPKGWAFCNGQLLPINQNQALFALLGTTYGGDGRVNFGLPNLQGRIALHVGSGLVLGATGGEATHTLVAAEMPSHTHPVTASTAPANQASPANGYWADSGRTALYAPRSASTGTMAPAAISTIGGQAHNNMPPYLVLNVIIALQGIFPSRN